MSESELEHKEPPPDRDSNGGVIMSESELNHKEPLPDRDSNGGVIIWLFFAIIILIVFLLIKCS